MLQCNLTFTLVNLVQVFDLVNREAFNPSLGVNVTGIRENHLELSINQEASVFISLQPSRRGDHIVDSADIHNLESALIPLETLKESNTEDRKKDLEKKSVFPNQISCEIYLQQIFHEQVFVRAKNRTTFGGKMQSSSQPARDRLNLLGHFCMSLAHRIFSNKILAELENLVQLDFFYCFLFFTWVKDMIVERKIYGKTNDFPIVLGIFYLLHH